MTDLLNQDSFTELELPRDVNIRLYDLIEAEKLMTIVDTSMYVEAFLIHTYEMGNDIYDLTIVCDEPDKVEGYCLGVLDTLRHKPECTVEYKAVYHSGSDGTAMYTFEPIE